MYLKSSFPWLLIKVNELYLTMLANILKASPDVATSIEGLTQTVLIFIVCKMYIFFNKNIIK